MPPAKQPATRREDRDRARRRFRLRQTALHGVGGLVLGYVVLHPVAMAIFAWFDRHDASGDAWPVLEGMVNSFTTAMLPMGTVFAAFGLLLGATDGYYRSLVGFQRNDLAQELQFKEAYRFKLEQTIEAVERQNDRLRNLELGKRRMTRFLVHDMKNHLGCVLGYANMLLDRSRKRGENGRDSDALERLRRQASRMLAAVNDLLDIARLDEIPGIERQRVRALTTLEDVLKSAALPPGQAQVRVDRRIDPELQVTCDSRLITRALSNLVLNAAKHNRHGVVITLNVYRQDRTVIFECRDTGNGIPEEISERLFDEFVTTGGSDQLAISHGLGLTFCKAVATAHGGRIWVDSKAGKGTIFSFTVPVEGTAT